MDTVIQEIANQLGMAVDQAGKFIQEQLPNFAALKVVQSSVPLYVTIGFFIVVTIACAISTFIRHKEYKAELEDWKNAETSVWSKRPYFIEDYLGITIIISASVSALLLISVVVELLLFLPDIIGWSNYPEAMLIDMALNAVK